jgi:molybdopterin converting factor small subunit
VGATVGDVLDRIDDEHLHFKSWRDRTAIAVNHEYVDEGHVLNEGDEVALIPPVSGG